MNDRTFQRLLYRRTTDELLELLELRESLVLFYGDINAGGPLLPLVTKSERMISLIKSELGRRGVLERDDVVARFNAQNLKFWQPFSDEERARFRQLRDELGL
jgi:hypothetical protein